MFAGRALREINEPSSQKAREKEKERKTQTVSTDGDPAGGRDPENRVKGRQGSHLPIEMVLAIWNFNKAFN